MKINLHHARLSLIILLSFLILFAIDSPAWSESNNNITANETTSRLLENVRKDDLIVPIYIATPGLDLLFKSDISFFKYGRNEIVVQPLDEDLNPVTDYHSLKFSVEPADEEISIIPANGITGTIAGVATVDLVIPGPVLKDDLGKTNYITLKIDDLTTELSMEIKVPLGPPLTLLAEPNNPDDDEDDQIAIIPADESYPARITAIVGGNLDYETKANRAVTFQIDPGKGELRGYGQAGYLIDAITDEYGRAEVYYHFTGDYDRQKIIDTVTIEDDTGEEQSVDIQIGLGLRFNDVEALLRQGIPSLTTSSQFALLAIITSEFNPGMILENYAYWAKDIWDGKEIGMYLELEWLNKPEPSWWEWLFPNSILSNSTYKGRCSFGQKGPANEKGYDVLIAKDYPNESIGGIHFPSLWIRSNGGHLFKATVTLVDVNSGSPVQEPPLMPFRFFEATVDAANSKLRDLTCFMSPTTKGDFLFQELLKKIPGNVGWGVSIFVAIQDIACKVADKKYGNAILAAGGLIGGEMLETILPKYGPDKIPESTFNLYGTGMNIKNVADWFVRAENMWKLKWSRESPGRLRQESVTVTEPDITLNQLANAFPIGMLTSIALFSDKQIITIAHAQSAQLIDENGTPVPIFDNDFAATGELVGGQVEDVFSFIVPKEGRYTLKAKTGENTSISICENNKVFQSYNLQAASSADAELLITNGQGGLLKLDYSGNGTVDLEINPTREILLTMNMEFDFDDGLTLNWRDDGSGYWSPSQGHYNMSGEQSNTIPYTYFDKEVTNFSCQVDVRKTAGDGDGWLYGYGLFLRGDGTWRNNYEFNMIKDGRYMIGKNLNGNFTKLVEYSPSDAFKKSEWVTLKVVADANILKFYADNQFLTEVTDNSFSAGKVGLFGVDSASSTSPDSVDFDNFILLSGEDFSLTHFYYLPYYNSAPEQGLWTGIGLANAEVEVDTRVKISVLGQNGRPLTEDIYLFLPGNGQKALPVAAELNGSGWLQVRASNPLSGLAFVGGKYMADIPFTEKLSTSLVIPHVAQDEQWNTSILVCNPNPTATEVTIANFYKEIGPVDEVNLRHCTKTLPAQGSANYLLAEIFNGQEPVNGMVTLTAEQGIAAFALYENSKTGGKYYAGINAVPLNRTHDPAQESIPDTIETKAATALPLNYNYFLPYYYSSPKQGYWTGIGLANTGMHDDTQVEVKVLGEDGNSLTGAISLSMAANGQQAFPVAAELEGSGWLHVGASNPISGLAFVGGKYMSDIPFTEKLSTSLVIPHIAQDDIWDTSILVCNPNAVTTNLTISNFYNTGTGTGINLREGNRTIPASGSGKYLLSEIFPGQEPLNGMVLLSTDQGIAAFALYENSKSGGEYCAGINAKQLNYTLDVEN